jgi:NAD(P) transhydrogenase subunit alpha
MNNATKSKPIATHRILLTLLAMLLGMVLASGCGGSDEPAPKPTGNTAVEPAPVATDPANSNVDSPADTSVAAVAQEMIEKTRPVAVEPEQGMSRTDALIAALTIFALAIFVGFELITKVPPTLHTPLMSGSNAISGITLVGAVLMAGNNQSNWAAFFGMLAVTMATINVVGGFMVTDRMLEMFQKK